MFALFRSQIASIGYSVFVALVLFLCLALQSASFTPVQGGVSATSTQFLLPANQPERGLVYDGLQVALDGPCKGLFKLKGTDLCTQGPEPAPPGVDIHTSVPPVDFTQHPMAIQVQCDGDGVTGNRVQVIYAHPVGTDRYNQYLTSFQQWMADMDAIFDASAAETGGSRHVRFVHDGSCKPIVENVTLSYGASDFDHMVTELQSLGYNRNDRKYIVFMDASVYGLGIGNFYWDDSLTPANRNNRGPSYTRHDVAMWGGWNPAHELMHTLGAVNSSSPHSTGNSHCWDEYDRMCYDDGGHSMEYICPDPAHEYRFDCNHDDYYHTNPPAGSYLATHWNAANNSFLIGAVGFVKTWTGATSTSWSDSTNWSPSGIPVTGEDCLIPAGKPRYPVIGAGETARCHGKLTVEVGAQIIDGPGGGLEAATAAINGTLQVLNGSYFDVESAVTIGPGGLLLLQNGDTGMWFEQGGTLSVYGTLQVTGTFPIYSSPPTTTANLLINPGGLVDILEGGLLTVDGVVSNNGTLKQTKTVTQNTTTSFLNITGTLGTTKYLGLDITLGAAGNMGRTSVAIQGNQMCSSAGPLLGLTVGRCYQITPTTSQTATVKFYYRSAEVWGQIAPNAYHFNGSTWDALTSTRGGSGEAMYVQATGVNSYSPFALKDPNIPTYRIYLPLTIR